MENNICKILGNNVKKYRKLRGYSQEKLSELVEIGITSLSLIERGKGFVTASTLEKLSKVLNISISVLMSDCEIEDEKSLIAKIQNSVSAIKHDKEKLKLLYEYLKILV